VLLVGKKRFGLWKTLVCEFYERNHWLVAVDQGRDSIRAAKLEIDHGRNWSKHSVL
jgi:hypothetical protein